MSLNWDISKVKNWEELYDKGTWKNDFEFEPDPKGKEKRLQTRTDALIWVTMSVGMGQITEKNHEEFFKRVAFLETIGSAYRMRGGKPVKYTLEDIKRHIGLSTNVSTETQAKWLKRQYDYWNPREAS